MAGLSHFHDYVSGCGFTVSGAHGAMRWTETNAGLQLTTKEEFKAFSGWQEGADGSFQSENQGEDGVRTLTSIKDIFTSPDWMKMVTAFHSVPG